MKLLILDPGLPARVEDRTGDLADLQQIVGGLIEALVTVPSREGRGRSVTAYANEEGLINDLPWCAVVPPHRHVIRGSIVVTALTRLGDTVGLTDKELEQVGVLLPEGWAVPVLLIVDDEEASNEMH